MPFTPAMEDTGPPAPTVVERLRNALVALVQLGRAARFQARFTREGKPGGDLFERVRRATTWALVLREVLAGSTILEVGQRPRGKATPRPAQAAPAAPAARPTPATPRPAPSEASLLRAAFRHPIGHITARLCTDLGIAQTSAHWPTELLAITLTPAQWTARLRAHAPTPKAEPQPNHATSPPPPELPPPPDRATPPQRAATLPPRPSFPALSPILCLADTS